MRGHDAAPRQVAPSVRIATPGRGAAWSMPAAAAVQAATLAVAGSSRTRRMSEASSSSVFSFCSTARAPAHRTCSCSESLTNPELTITGRPGVLHRHVAARWPPAVDGDLRCSVSAVAPGPPASTPAAWPPNHVRCARTSAPTARRGLSPRARVRTAAVDCARSGPASASPLPAGRLPAGALGLRRGMDALIRPRLRPLY